MHASDVPYVAQVGEDRLREEWASERLPGGDDLELARIDIGSSRLWKKRGKLSRHSPMHSDLRGSNASSRNSSRPARPAG